jgi:hypothetical protein
VVDGILMVKPTPLGPFEFTFTVELLRTPCGPPCGFWTVRATMFWNQLMPCNQTVLEADPPGADNTAAGGFTKRKSVTIIVMSMEWDSEPSLAVTVTV